jgi:outer membrane protein OmpA-like peptidoglycan-associated protein
MKNLFISALSLLTFTYTFAQKTIVNNDEETSLIYFDEANDVYTVLPTNVNTKQSEVGTAIFRNKFIMYSSRRTGAIGAGKDENTKLPFNTIYCNEVDKNGNLSKPYFFASSLDARGNEGGLTFSKDEKNIYYTKTTKDNTKNYQLYKATFNGVTKRSWDNEVSVAFNSADYSIENPTLSQDGKQMYFSSNMPGGFGGHDIYVAQIDAAGMPINPVNLGNKINTVGDEKFPFISLNKEIYFSSNGHNGYGGQDVFIAKIKKSGYGLPLNLGRTINTSADEIGFMLSNKTKGYLSSDRQTGMGYFDVYRFDVLRSNNDIKGKSIEKESKIVLPNTLITLLNEDDEVIGEQTTGENGEYKFDVSPLEKYTLVASKDGYQNFKTSIVSNSTDIVMVQKKAEIVINEDKKFISIENIYFDYNKASIKKESTLSLNKILEVLNENPAMKISIFAHTDSRGSDKYNLSLSDKRAAQAKKYLVSKGIDVNRINFKGFGETQSLSNCNNKCTEEQYLADRRVEFVIE